MSVNKKKSSYHHGDLRQTLLDAAESLLEEGGIDALSLRDAARRAGVSHSAPARHFPAKMDLLFALVERGIRALDDEMRRAGAIDADPVAQLEEAGFAYVRLAVRHPWRTQLMFGGVVPMQAEIPPGLQEVASSSFQGLVRIITAGQAAGRFIEQDPMQLTLAMWSVVHGTAMLILGGQYGYHDRSDSKQFDDRLREIMRISFRVSALGMLRDEHRGTIGAQITPSSFVPPVGGQHGCPEDEANS